VLKHPHVPEPDVPTSAAESPARTPRRTGTESVAIADQVASVLRHDLRNKFASILNAASYIERSLDKLGWLEKDARISRFLQLIGKELEAADELLDQRTRHAERSSRAFDMLRLDECVLEAIARTTLPKLVALEIFVEAQPRFRANFEEIVLTVQCLLDNAVEAAVPRGHVRVTVCESAADFFVCVLDSGPGIPADERTRALEPFVSNKPEHAGLGLNIAARLAGLHGGRLLIDGSHECGGAQACLAFARRE
jgi:signal transduction histidine kinase